MRGSFWLCLARLDLGQPPAQFVGSQDALVQERLSNGGYPALVVAEAVVFGGAKGFNATAQLVHGHDAAARQQPEQGVGPFLPRGVRMFAEVDRSGGQAAEIMVRAHGKALLSGEGRATTDYGEHRGGKQDSARASSPAAARQAPLTDRILGHTEGTHRTSRTRGCAPGSRRQLWWRCFRLDTFTIQVGGDAAVGQAVRAGVRAPAK